MKYLNTKHEKNSAKLTALIAVILLLLLFVVGTTYMDPPEEYGVAVNFGNSDFGKGNVQPLKPVKSEPLEIDEPPQPDVFKAEPAPAKTSEVKEEVLTAENAETIAIKKQKQAEKAIADAKAKEKAKADAKAKAEAYKIAKEKRDLEEKKKKLDALIGGVSKSEGSESGSEGNDNKSGDKGQLDGDPYAPYNGIPGAGKGGVGYGLNGRGKPSFKVYEGCTNEYGLVVVNVVVNRNGNVIEVTPGTKGTTNISSCLREVAKKFAMSSKWPPNSEAPTRQYGKITLNFTPGN